MGTRDLKFKSIDFLEGTWVEWVDHTQVRSHSSHIASHHRGLRVFFCTFFALKANPGYSYALTKLSHLGEKWGEKQEVPSGVTDPIPYVLPCLCNRMWGSYYYADFCFSCIVTK